MMVLNCGSYKDLCMNVPSSFFPNTINTGNTIALTRQTVVGKVMSLLLNMLSRLVITFLPRSLSVF